MPSSSVRPADSISVVVPALNEEGSIRALIDRIAATLNAAHIAFEIIVIDDHSTDGTAYATQTARAQHPTVRLLKKSGRAGKAFSLLQGFRAARYDIVCMIDADLQYPPEAIVPMYRKLVAHRADIVITNRAQQATGWLRRFVTHSFNVMCTRLLFGIHYDAQSGLKLFRKQVLATVQLSPSRWSFDLEFLVRALEQGYTVIDHDIRFAKRATGTAKVHIVSTSLEIAWATLKLRTTTSRKKIRHGYRQSLEVADARRLGRALSEPLPPGMWAIALLTASMLVPLLQPAPTQALRAPLPAPSFAQANPPASAAESKPMHSPSPATTPTGYAVYASKQPSRQTTRTFYMTIASLLTAGLGCVGVALGMRLHQRSKPRPRYTKHR